MTINATAAILLALYLAVAREQGVPVDKAQRHDPERHSQGVHRARHLHLSAAPVAAPRSPTSSRSARAKCRSWNTISISGYHIREAGSTAVQEVAFTLADAIAYVEAAIDAGLEVDDFAPRLSFFFNAHNDLLEEIAKFRAARRLWARIMRDRFGATDPALADAALPHADRRLDAHRAAAGSQCRAHDDPGAGRGARRHAVAAHERAWTKRWRCRPKTRRASRCARSSHRVRIGRRRHGRSARRLVLRRSAHRRPRRRADDHRSPNRRDGRRVAAVERGWMQDQHRRRGLPRQQAMERGEAVVVGVRTSSPTRPADAPIPLQRIDPRIERDQVARSRAFREARDQHCRSTPARSGPLAATAART